VVASPTSNESVTLINLTNANVSLAGWTIGDLNDPEAYTIPGGVVLNIGESLTFNANTMGFQINDSGETIYLKDGVRCIYSWSN